MKNLVLLCFITLSFFLTSCQKNLIDSAEPSFGTMSCSIDGKSFTTSDVGAVNVIGLLSITADEKSSGTTVTLGIDSDDAKAGKIIDVGDITGGSFASSLTAVMIKKNGQEIVYAASEGKITITSASKSEVSGTFNFTATDFANPKNNLKVTNGKFSAKILF
jgi:Family of unknown function (DUF6252)